MLGERLRQARLAAGLSLEGLAAKLERPVTKQALSKYEQGVSEPGPSRLADIAAALNVRESTLLAEPAVEIEWVAYRKLARLRRSHQEQVTALAAQRLEDELGLREMFHIGDHHDLPGPIDVQHLNDCEYAAAALRMRWGLEYRPVSSLVETVEAHGGIVLMWQAPREFDGLSGWANRTPVMVLNGAAPPDRRRLSAAHELGHLVMRASGDAKQDEQFAFRFAAAFLVPADAARHEIGTHRRGLSMEELGLLKQRWGLSMQGWIRRARDLEIISAGTYQRLNMQFRRDGWHREEPVHYEAAEAPALFHRLVLRAQTEQMITPEEAERLYPGVSR